MSVIYVLDHDTMACKALQQALPSLQFRFFDTLTALQQALTETPQRRGFVRGFLCNLPQEKANDYAFARWLKQSAFKDVPLIWLTPRLSWEELESSLLEGGKDCVFKPFLPGVLQRFASRNFDSIHFQSTALTAC